MPESLEQSLKLIRLDFLKMLSISLEQLDLIRKALYQRNYYNLGKMVKNLDLEIDALEIEIEEACLSAIALYQPVAIDLRLISVVFKSLTDAERIGDYATHIAKDLENLAPSLTTSQYADIIPLLNQLAEMLDKLSYAFAEKHDSSLQELAQMDLLVDVLYEQLQRSTITRILEAPRSTTSIFKLSQLARSFERLGDHIVNISERLSYWMTGVPYQKQVGNF